MTPDNSVAKPELLCGASISVASKKIINTQIQSITAFFRKVAFADFVQSACGMADAQRSLAAVRSEFKSKAPRDRVAAFPAFLL